MAVKILQVEKKPLISSECWTYYKFALMQNVYFFDVWLANHMKIYLDQNVNATFGENGSMYPLSYYSDILDISDANIVSVPTDEIVQFLINQIDINNYIVIDINFGRLNNIDSSQMYFREALIYGYDTEREEFLTPMLSYGGFKETRVGFKVLALAYSDAHARYIQDKSWLFNRRAWFYGITILKPKNSYENTNAYYDFLLKLRWEEEGNIYTRQRQAGDFENIDSYTYYTGSSCLLYLSKHIEKLSRCGNTPDEDIKNCLRSCLKVFENQKIIFRSMKWFVEKVDYKNELLANHAHKYGKCCEQMYMDMLILDKYLYKKDNVTLPRVKKSLEKLYWQEKDILNEYIIEATNAYTKELHVIQ